MLAGLCSSGEGAESLWGFQLQHQGWADLGHTPGMEWLLLLRGTAERGPWGSRALLGYPGFANLPADSEQPPGGLHNPRTAATQHSSPQHTWKSPAWRQPHRWAGCCLSNGSWCGSGSACGRKGLPASKGGTSAHTGLRVPGEMGAEPRYPARHSTREHSRELARALCPEEIWPSAKPAATEQCSLLMAETRGSAQAAQRAACPAPLGRPPAVPAGGEGAARGC